jgi:aspartyl-tRNA(Asn)/glutamyl-tRNA(Gln) amidotransferase subunit A
VEDAALVLSLASRADARDPGALPPDGADYAAGLQGGIKGWKIAMSLTLGYARKVHPELAAALRKAAEVLAGLGASVEERDPGIEDPIEPYLTLLQGGFRYAMRAATAEQKALLAPGLREILNGPEVTLIDYLRAQEHCQGLARHMNAFHEQYDLLITPTVAWPAFPAERHYPEQFEPFPNRRAWVPFASLFNLTQQPAITVPAGLTSDGLPAGLHIVGPRLAEAKVLRAAAAFEAACPFTQRPSMKRKH